MTLEILHYETHASYGHYKLYNKISNYVSCQFIYFFCSKSIWPVVDPSWPLHDLWPQQCITLWSRVLPTKFGGLRAFLSNLTSGWPCLTPAWPLTPAMHYTSGQGFFLPNLVAIGHFLSNLTLVDSRLTPAWPLTPAMHYALVWRGSFLSNLVAIFLSNLTSGWPDDPCMTFDPSNALHSGQGFFLPNLVAIGHF